MLQEFTAKWHSLVPEGERVLLAVSGGADSLCLLQLCIDAALSERIAVAHCNFHLRGAESDADAAFVERFCAERGVKFHHCDFDTLGRSASNGVSVEMAARELRYGYFAGLCASEGYYATAVAHNSNDNAETLILNLLRGTGLRGICGMAETSEVLGGRVIRPLLGFSRARIEEYVRGKGLIWREDRTNSDCIYSRNRIRNRIFPELAQINPSFLSTLCSDMQHFAQAAGVLDEYWTKSGKRIEIAPGEVSIEALRSEPQREYLLWRFVEPAGLSEGCLASLSRLLFSSDEGKTLSGKVFEGSNARILTARGRLVLSYDSPAGGAEVTASGPGVYELLGKRVEIRLEDYVPDMEHIGRQLIADAAKISFPLKLRGWRSGDWICPFGMRGRRKKLSDVFTELGYSASQKARAVVVELDGSHAALVSGYRIDEALRVDSDTTKVLVFKIL